MRKFDVAVLGAGPVGLITALQLARHGQSVVIVSKTLPQADSPRRVDAAPAAFLALLVDFEIHPALVGADRLHDRRFSAWESDDPVVSEGVKTAHLERPALDIALLDRVRHAGVPIMLPPFHLQDGDASGHGWQAQRIVDATGRAAVTATRRIRPPRPWVARTFWISRANCQADPAFSIAALPDGYVYRLGGAFTITLGIAGRGAAVAGSVSALEQRLLSSAPWLLQGLPAPADMTPGVTCAASTQWTENNSGLRIGDAALARDALSSQGIAAGTSEALLAATASSANDLELIRARQREQRQAHLTSLLHLIARSRYSDLPVWRDYRAFLARHIEVKLLSAGAALKGGRIKQGFVPPQTGNERMDSSPGNGNCDADVKPPTIHS
jgi:flavin-dependent dehydrogenase